MHVALIRDITNGSQLHILIRSVYIHISGNISEYPLDFKPTTSHYQIRVTDCSQFENKHSCELQYNVVLMLLVFCLDY